MGILLTQYQDSDGRELAVRVDAARILQTPEWNGREEPPLGIIKAVGIARESLKDSSQTGDDAQTIRIELARVADKGPLSEHWYYIVTVVHVRRGSGNQAALPSIKSVVVLLDGVVAHSEEVNAP